jgi:hypothetical protein
MQLEETRDALNKFAKYVIQQSRSNLSKSKKNFSKQLYNSLDYDLNVSKKRPPASAFSNWVVRKGLKGTRDAKGRFVSRKGLMFAVANSIFKKGIKPSMFFTTPFQKAFKDLPEELILSFGLDLERFIDFTIKDNLKK